MTRLLAPVVIVLSLGACLTEGGDALCDDDIDNDADGRVDCADPSCDLAATCSPCGDGQLDEAEACDDGNRKDDDGCSARCMIEGCGNGVLDPGEECDDGNVVAADGCNFRCEIDRCGDGFVNASEQCDDGNIFSGDGCSRSCRAEPEVTCGNGRFDPGEECEDGNRRDGDGCTHLCRGEFCGDGVVQPALGEQCEGSALPDGTVCRFCRLFVCGNGTVDVGEQCDDGNTFDGDGCTSFCTVERCGDFILQSGEQCDDGNTVSGDFCSAECQNEFCGDGVVQPRTGELCDRGLGCGLDCRPQSLCATRPDDEEVCFAVDVRNASFVPRSLAAVRTSAGLFFETASIQAGFVDRFDPSSGGAFTQPSYPRQPILLVSVDIDGDGLDETVTSNFDATVSLQRIAGQATNELWSHSLVEDGFFVFPLDLRAAPLFSDAPSAADPPSAILSLAQTGSLLVAHLTVEGARAWVSVPPQSNRVAGASYAPDQGMVWTAAGPTLHPIRATFDAALGTVALEPEDAIALGADIGDLTVAALEGDRALLVLTKAPDQLVSMSIGADGALGEPQPVASTPGADFFAVGDVDQDGLLDIVTANNSHTLTLHLAADDFAASSTLASAATPTRPVLADFDADGRTDLAAGGGFFTPQLILYRGQP